DGLYGSGRLNAARALTESWRSRAVRLGGKLVGAPAVFRMANGGTRVAIACDNRVLVLFDGATLDTLWSATLPFTPMSGPAVGAIPGVGMGIFVALASGGVAGYGDDGNVLPQWPKTGGSSAMRSGAAVWDIDGDGPPEVIAGADDGRVWAWHVNGDLVSGFPVQVSSMAGTVYFAVSHDQPARIAVTTQEGSLSLIEPNGTV